jgi:hypothetical protein
MAPQVHEHTDLYRRHVQRILRSQEFSNSRQIREFLLYISEAAFEGRTHIDQVEIAEKVLEKGKGFNPLDDASVRKLGTALRHRLERYYENEGRGDEAQVTLPVRSYVPRFDLRSAPVAADSPSLVTPPMAGPAVRQVSRRDWLHRAGFAVAGLTGAAAGYWAGRPSQSPGLSPRIARPLAVIASAPGDIMHQLNNVAPGSQLFGNTLEEHDEITALMTFTPERATQQAGILAYQDADHYVKFGRQFLARPQLEFGMETAGRYNKPRGTFAEDPEAQTGDPVWMSIRRRGAEYRAFLSHDGIQWRGFGNTLIAPENFKPTRVAIFANNGRSDAPSAEARFHQVSTGLAFHNRAPGPVDWQEFSGWRSQFGPEPEAELNGHDLAILFNRDQGQNFVFARRAPAGDWSFTTRIDFQPEAGSAAGLSAQGTKGRFRLIRWDLDGGSISAEHLGNRQLNRKDFQGAPALYLRIAQRAGRLTGSFSRDGRSYEAIPLEVPLAALTDRELTVGLHTSVSSWKPGEIRPPARFYFARWERPELAPK